MSKPYIREYARGPSHELKTLHKHSTQIDVAPSVVGNDCRIFEGEGLRVLRREVLVFRILLLMTVVIVVGCK